MPWFEATGDHRLAKVPLKYDKSLLWCQTGVINFTYAFSCIMYLWYMHIRRTLRLSSYLQAPYGISRYGLNTLYTFLSICCILSLLQYVQQVLSIFIEWVNYENWTGYLGHIVSNSTENILLTRYQMLQSDWATFPMFNTKSFHKACRIENIVNKMR